MDNQRYSNIPNMDLGKLEKKLLKDGEPTLFPMTRNAYADSVEEENGSKRALTSVGDLVRKRMPEKKGRATERGELLKYFDDNITNKAGKKYGIPFFGRKLQGIPTKDLYYLKSVCESESKRTFEDKQTGKTVQITVGMVFWREIKAK